MPEKLTIKGRTVRLLKCDITDLEIESFVFYAREDLALGSGFGNAISVRGGPSIQQELDNLGPVETTAAVISSAGELKADYIIHAVGPKFQEEDLEEKLRTTVLNALKAADQKGIKAVAFPAMGAGFYGVPLEISAAVTLGIIIDYLSGETGIEDTAICLLDSREFKPFENQLSSMAAA
ncbi:MAG: O-acetyl-ADP-ribose deacetylase [Candidatus Zixiibacteriota bacterium]|nr:MAG: O-acetyl-ADP-ribose deacetylase [candidate division Zixibacteria bacterium]HDL03171.1 O-acetyl-ADP-ribose deacetylase [candidate division Zixibacteria bacterium]